MYKSLRVCVRVKNWQEVVCDLMLSKIQSFHASAVRWLHSLQCSSYVLLAQRCCVTDMCPCWSAGSVGAACVLLVLLALVFWCCLRRWRRPRQGADGVAPDLKKDSLRSTTRESAWKDSTEV